MAVPDFAMKKKLKQSNAYVDGWGAAVLCLFILGILICCFSKPVWNSDLSIDTRIIPDNGIQTVWVTFDHDHWFEVLQLKQMSK